MKRKKVLDFRLCWRVIKGYGFVGKSLGSLQQPEGSVSVV